MFARVESLSNPTGIAFEDHAPNGNVYRVVRRRVADGGTVTVITDITELKRIEQDLAQKEGQLHIALDNMPGALAYTDEALNIVLCNDRFAEMYPVPKELLAARASLSRSSALPRGKWLLRRGRRRGDGSTARREPAQSHRHCVRRSHAGRPVSIKWCAGAPPQVER